MSEATRSPEEIERAANKRRGEVNETIDRIKDSLSPETLADAAADYVRGPAGQRLIWAVRDNPLAALMAVAGIGWLSYTASKYGSGMAAPYGRQGDPSRPGVMGDQTEEQDLGQTGNPGARITKDEVEEAFHARPSTGSSLPH